MLNPELISAVFSEFSEKLSLFLLSIPELYRLYLTFKPMRRNLFIVLEIKMKNLKVKFWMKSFKSPSDNEDDSEVPRRLSAIAFVTQRTYIKSSRFESFLYMFLSIL